MAEPQSIHDYEADLKRVKARAQRAELILKNELVQEAFKEIEDQLIMAIRESKLEQQVEREDAYRCLRLLARLKDGLSKHMRDGTLAEYKLGKLEDRKKFALTVEQYYGQQS